MKNFLLFLLLLLVIFFPIRTNSAEILQINSSNSILVGDQNRSLSIELVCLQINEKDEQIAIDLLKKEFPRGSKVKIKPVGFKEKSLVARVFNLNEKKEMSELLIAKDLAKENCQN